MDNNCAKAAACLPKRRTLTLKQARLSPDATDREIVKTASDRKWIIVTSNGDDFQSTKHTCHDLAGPVILPSAFETQKNFLPKVEQRLFFNGRHLSWKDVWELNYGVRITKTGKVHVTRPFGRCFYCKKLGAE